MVVGVESCSEKGVKKRLRAWAIAGPAACAGSSAMLRAVELPFILRAAAQQAAEGVALTQLTRAVETLSGRYRAEVLDQAWHVSDDLAARAYLVTRLPATFAAVSAAMQALLMARPDFEPTSQLDVGAGPGTAFWAAQTTWPSLQQALLLEGSDHMRGWGQRMAQQSSVQSTWQATDVRRGLPETGAFDLVTLAYVLNELDEVHRADLTAELWERTADTLLIVEPGTPAGWQRILAARSQLLEQGAYLLAPCPHALGCPVHLPDWCHFSQRVARSRLHRQGKSAELAYEDEKFIYLAASRHRGQAFAGRVLTRPLARAGLITLKLCTAEGQLENRSISKRQGGVFKLAKKLEWGDEV